MINSTPLAKITSLFIILMLFMGSVFPQTPSVEQLLNYPEGTILVAAHRGDTRNHPENSLSAIQSCIDHGIDVVEIDVQRTRDGHFVLMHDYTITRTTNGRGRVSSYSLEKLKTLRLREPGGYYGKETIPTLEEAILLAKGRIVLNLDKSGRYFDEILAMVDSLDARQTVIMKGVFSYKYLSKRVEENVDGPIMMPILNYKAKADLDTFLLFSSASLAEVILSNDTAYMTSPAGLAYFKEMNCRIWYNALHKSLALGYNENINAIATWDSLIANQAYIIQTDYPCELMQYLVNTGHHIRPDSWKEVSLAGLPKGVLLPPVDTVKQVVTQDNITVTNHLTTPVTQNHSTSKPAYHTVRSGDTLSEIARKYKTSVSAICKLNKNLRPTTLLQIGQRIKIR